MMGYLPKCNHERENDLSVLRRHLRRCLEIPSLERHVVALPRGWGERKPSQNSGMVQSV